MNRAGAFVVVSVPTAVVLLFVLWMMAVLSTGFLNDALARGSSEKVQRTADFFIAVNGCDQWSGQLDQPNRTNTDGPFATLA